MTLVSRSSLGALGNGHSRSPALSGDGRYVAFASRASNLVAGDSNAVWDVFVHDRVSASTVRVSVDTGGAEGNADSLLPSISAGGGCVTFTSWASNLVAGDGNLVLDVFVHELSTGLTECADVTAAGTPAFYGAQRSFLSADGRCVAFESGSNDLVTGDTNSMPDVFVLDRWSGVTTRVSVDSSGAEANDLCLAGPLSSDRRFVIFTSLASNLVPFDLNAAQDVFVHDRASASTTRISVDALGSDALGVSAAGALSGTGRIAVFSSYAANLVAGDTNGAQDVFAIDRGPIPAAPPTSYCTAGTSSIGCSAVISASAQPSLSAAHACTIGVSGLEGQRAGWCSTASTTPASPPTHGARVRASCASRRPCSARPCRTPPGRAACAMARSRSTGTRITRRTWARWASPGRAARRSSFKRGTATRRRPRPPR